MSGKIDWLFCGLLAIAAAGHAFGTFSFYALGSELFVWSLSGVLAAVLLVALNMLRITRPQDKGIAWIALVGDICWIAVALLFGVAIGKILDPRVLFHALSAAGLGYFSLRSVLC